MANRIEYIDCIKGFTILWVVVFHFGEIVPPWVAVTYRIPLFFFMSGIFFRQRQFKEFFVKRINTLIIPLIFFWGISVLFSVLKYEILAPFLHSIEIVGIGSFSEYAFSFLKLADVSIADEMQPMALNIALWFLIGLFNVQMLYYFLRKWIAKQWIILSFTILCYILSVVLYHYQINGLFYLARSLQFLVYYTLGNLFGNYLVQAIDTPKQGRYIGMVSLIGLVCFSLFDAESSIGNHILLNIRILLFVPVVFVFFKETYHLAVFRPLLFFGKNSLTLLGTHFLIFSFCNTVVIKFMGLFSAEELANSTGYYVVLFFIVCAVSYLFIRLFNGYLPWFVGKKNLIKLKSYE